ncbi:hypothetical protein AMATHDRAFT_11345 [Amanita thiersii Skay4041]|uniref:Uncharacterized protein n=1 Tax=Amanita thiersii Skay4041 TaxID=703135 RepID=A0A2A9N5Z6_9AGAR|nr:hypothetical protein AMATHDRAFT_11345 [Amanita thiersii Skay4041]
MLVSALAHKDWNVHGITAHVCFPSRHGTQAFTVAFNFHTSAVNALSSELGSRSVP